jgi:hypothetical protein
MSHLIEAINEIEASLPALATAGEAAHALRMSPRNLRRLIVAGRIGAMRERESGSSRVLVPRAEIGRYLRSLAVQP